MKKLTTNQDITKSVRQTNKDDRQKRAAAMSQVFSNLNVAKKKTFAKR
jgi:hypothetical protein